MVNIYVVTGSEDGILGAGTNKKEALEAAKKYVLQCLENQDKFVNESDLEIKESVVGIIEVKSERASVYAEVEIFESNQYYY